MASKAVRLMEPQSPAASTKQSRTEAQDFGAYRTLQVQPRVLKAGSGGNISLEHAAVNEEEAYTTISGTSVALNATSNTPITVSNFLRWVRWATDGSVAGTPLVLIDIIAKE
jgi:hypothetical protein